MGVERGSHTTHEILTPARKSPQPLAFSLVLEVSRGSGLLEQPLHVYLCRERERDRQTERERERDR